MGRHLPAAVAIAAIAVVAGPAAAAADAPTECPGDPIDPDEVFTGEFSSNRQGSFVFLPFRVPDDKTQVRVKYCHDQPESPTSAQVRHTLDLGLYEPRDRSDEIWETDEFRGWGGSGYDDATVTPEGFTGARRYREDPKAHVPGRTTRSFVPGAIREGKWAVELGLAAVASEQLGDADGKVAWRVEVEIRGNRRFANDPYAPANYDLSPARRDSGWYAGDFHVHAEHSGDSDVTMDEALDYAFAPPSEGGAGLDFVTLTDHNTTSAWGEIGRLQEDHPNRLVARSQEVTTYRGHANQHVSGAQVDYRTGDLFRRQSDGDLRLVRDRRGASGIFRKVHKEGGFAQINHPTIFPSSVPGFAFLCRGCSWDYSGSETRYSRVDAIEIATGPPGLQRPIEIGPNPFTTTAIDFWEDKLARGHKIAPVGSSDSHDAGEPDSPTEAPIGTATTVVRARELSEGGVECAVKAGRTYVKVFGQQGPDLRFTARPPGSGGEAIMGDTVSDDEARFRARVIGGGGAQLVVLRNNAPILAVPVVGGDFSLPFDSLGPGRYRLQVQRTSSIEAVSSPIYLEPGAEPNDRPCGPFVVE